MIKGSIKGPAEVNIKLQRIGERVPQEVRASIGVLVLKVARLVKQKLSGPVLSARTGNLRNSIDRGIGVVETDGGVVGVVGLGGADLKVAKYGAIHEFGGTIRAHVVHAKKAQALRFMMGGKVTFAKSVQIPSIKMPERSFLRSSLKEMEPAIRSGIEAAVNKAIRGAKQ